VTLRAARCGQKTRISALAAFSGVTTSDAAGGALSYLYRAYSCLWGVRRDSRRTLWTSSVAGVVMTSNAAKVNCLRDGVATPAAYRWRHEKHHHRTRRERACVRQAAAPGNNHLRERIFFAGGGGMGGACMLASTSACHHVGD